MKGGVFRALQGESFVLSNRYVTDSFRVILSCTFSFSLLHILLINRELMISRRSALSDLIKKTLCCKPFNFELVSSSSVPLLLSVCLE